MARINDPDAPLVLRLIPILEAVMETLTSHIREHNVSGGPLDWYSGIHLERGEALLAELKGEVTQDESE